MKSLNEFKVGSLQKNIKVNVDIEATKHALERQTRHGDDNIIEMDEVTYIIDKAMPQIIDSLIHDDIDVDKDDRVVLQDKYTETTVAGVVNTKRNSDDLVFVVITVYRGNEFRTSKNQKIIKV